MECCIIPADLQVSIQHGICGDIDGRKKGSAYFARCYGLPCINGGAVFNVRHPPVPLVRAHPASTTCPGRRTVEHSSFVHWGAWQ